MTYQKAVSSLFSKSNPGISHCCHCACVLSLICLLDYLNIIREDLVFVEFVHTSRRRISVSECKKLSLEKVLQPCVELGMDMRTVITGL